MSATVPYASVRPVRSLDLLSQQEMASLANSNEEVHRLFRRCALAVLNVDAETDDTARILEQYRQFEIRVIAEPRGVRLELLHAPASTASATKQAQTERRRRMVLCPGSRSV